MPQSAIAFSSEDHRQESSRVTDVEQIIDDRNVQELQQQCPKCARLYKVFYQFSNKDTRLVCECDRPAYEDIPTDVRAGLTNREDRRLMYSSAAKHYHSSRLAYIKQPDNNTTS